jgi:glycosyltransferase involved in cell wall biosynthesis
MTLPAVSVVIPSYNHGRFIGEAVDSVLGSPFAELELVIVDDGSTDDTLQRLAAYRDDRRVRIEEQPNRGAHAALNRGLELARG